MGGGCCINEFVSIKIDDHVQELEDCHVSDGLTIQPPTDDCPLV